MKDQGEAKQETDVDGAVEEVIKCITDIERQGASLGTSTLETSATEMVTNLVGVVVL